VWKHWPQRELSVERDVVECEQSGERRSGNIGLHVLCLKFRDITITTESSVCTIINSIQFHCFISSNEAHTDKTNIIQEDRESVQSTENTQTHLHN